MRAHLRVCPAQELGPGGFDVVDRPGPEFAYDRAAGWRVDSDGRPVRVHPYHVGMPPGRYASAGVPLPELGAAVPTPTPAAFELPSEVNDLEGWLVATLRVAAPKQLSVASSESPRTASCDVT
ncbi:hypothetical protein GCM10029963_33090 [Micromonospora andamanensis]|nr:hypothetical protein Vwe01_53610 [Micromonospora andamanensis]